MTCSILLVSDSRDSSDTSLRIKHAANLSDAAASSSSLDFDAIVVSESALDRSLDFSVEELRRAYPRTPFIFLMERWADETMIRAQRDGFDGILPRESLNEENIADLLRRTGKKTEALSEYRAMKNNARFFEGLFENSHAVMLLIDPQSGEILEGNAAACRYYGYSHEELEGMPLPSVTPTNFGDELQQSGEGGVISSTHRLSDGSLREVEMFVGLVKQDGRDILHAIVQDVTECNKANRELRRRSRQEELTAEIISDFAFGRSREEFSEAVDRALAVLGEHNEVERAYLFLVRGDLMDNTHEWCAHGIASQKALLQDLPTSMFPWWMENLRTNGAFYIPEVIGMPPEAGMEKELLERQGVHSLVVFAVEAEGELKGFVGFDNVPAGVISPENDFPLLSSIAKVIGRALALVQADEALKSSEQRYQSIVEKQSDLIVRFTPAGEITFCNPAYARYFGGEPVKFIGTNIKLFLPADTGYLDEYFSKLKPDAPQSSMQDKIVMPDGSVRWPLWNDTGFFDEDGNLTEIQSVGWDMTELKNALAEKETQRRRLRALFDISPDGIAVCGDGIRIDEANDAFFEMLGLRPEEALGTRIEDILASPDGEEASRKADFFRRARTEEGIMEEEVRIEGNGGALFLSLASLPVPNGESGKQGRYYLLRNLTPLKMREEELRRNLETLRKTFRQTIDVLSSATEIRDPYTAGHQRRVARLAMEIARRTGMSEDALEGLALAASVHDIGKISIPSEILSKPGVLSELEFSFIRTHPREGFDMLRKVDFPWRLAEIVLQHHERMDGSGYPQGLAGDAILPEARILAVADVVEAVASHRPYRPSKGIDEALRIVREGRGGEFDPLAADACIALFEEGYSLESD